MEPDHCTLFPEGSWGACCAQHDIDYADITIARLTADLDLAACVAAVGGWPMAALMFAGVTAFGWYFRWRWFRRNPSTTQPASSGLFVAPKEATMAADNFALIMDQIFRHEGGYVDHPRDPGGATNMGITFATLRDYRGKDITKADVKSLTKTEAHEIYRKRYWEPVSGDELPSGVDLCVMDSAVNSGPSRGARWLQRAVGAKADGKIGTMTLAACEGIEPATIVNRMCDDRMNFLKGLSTWGTFGRGWTRRVEEVRAMALELAKAPVTIAIPTQRPETSIPVSEKPTPEAIHDANAEPWYQSRVTWGAIIAAAVPALTAAGVTTDWLDPDEATSVLVAIGTAAGAILTIVGRWKAKRPIGTTAQP